jgi:hypothetical protein
MIVAVSRAFGVRRELDGASRPLHIEQRISAKALHTVVLGK